MKTYIITTNLIILFTDSTFLIMAMSNPYTSNGYGRSSTVCINVYGLVGKCAFHWFFIIHSEYMHGLMAKWVILNLQ
jgi:hypothetical protein